MLSSSVIPAPCIRSLPDHSQISPQSLPSRIVLQFNLQFWYSWVDGDAYRSSSLWTSEAVLLNFLLASEAENFNTPSNIAFTYIVHYSLNEPSKILLTKYPLDWPCIPNPPNILPPMQSSERPPCPRFTSQSKNGPKYHFHLGLIYADDLQAPNY